MICQTVLLKAEPGAVPTIAELGAHVDWFWAICDGCRWQTPIRLAPVVERYGGDASSDVTRRSARCSACGHKGATLQRPRWAGEEEQDCEDGSIALRLKSRPTGIASICSLYGYR